VRRIIHIDMDAFYASVEQRDRPELRGTPVAVGGRPEGRGVVAASSYEARAFGVRSAMSMARAVRLCPHLAVVPPDFAKYQAVSATVFGLFRAVTSLVEPLSLDEAYLDVTENAWSEPLAVNVARRLKEQIRENTGLTASAGVAPNKFLAKIGSGWKKPDGLTVVAPERVESFLQRLPVDALWGVGPVTAARLRSIRLERLVDVRLADPELLRRTIGSHAGWLIDLAHGIDNRPVEPFRPRKSVGTENHLRRRPRRPHADRRGNQRDGGGRRRVAVPQGPVREHGDDQSAVRRLHDRHAERHAAAGHERRRQPGAAGGGAARSDRGRNAAGAAARRQPPRPGRPSSTAGAEAGRAKRRAPVR